MSDRRRLLTNEYYNRVLGIKFNNLIGYWPLWEPLGTLAKDLSREANDGAYTGVDLGQQPGIGDGRPVPWFDGTNDYCDVYSAALNTDFSGAEGTLICWIKANGSGVWTDNADRQLVRLRADGSNSIDLWKWGGNNNLYWEHRGGGTLKQVSAAVTGLGWYAMALTWSAAASEVRACLNGVQQGATQAGQGAWSGALNSAQVTLGAGDTTPAKVWHGWLGHCALWSTPLTPAEIAYLAVL